MHYQTPSKRQRVWSGALWILGLCAAVAAFAWPPVIERIAHYRWVLGLFSVWCFALSGYLSGFWGAFADAIREDWFDDDDDDFHAA
jgi:hypothetical protein